MKSPKSSPSTLLLSAFLMTVVLVAVVLAPTVLADNTTQRPLAEKEIDTSAVSMELIMSDPDWIGNAPERPYWSDAGDAIYYYQKRTGEQHDDLFRLSLEKGEAHAVTDEDQSTVDVDGGDLSSDRRWKTYSHEGDIYFKDLQTGNLRQLTRTNARERNPQFLLGDWKISFQRGDDIFIRELDTGLEIQAADVRLSDDPADEEEPTDYLSKQQPRLLEVIREQQEREKAAQERKIAEQEADPHRMPLPFYLGTKIEVRQSLLSPTGEQLLLVTADAKRDNGKEDQMPNYISEDGYVSVRDVRSKVGTNDGSGNDLLLLDLRCQQKHAIDLSTLPGIADDPLAWLREAKEEGEGEEGAEGEEQKEAEEKEEKEAEPREVWVRSEWSPDGKHVAILAFSTDNKDRWLAVVPVSEECSEDAPEIVPVHRLSDEAWITWDFNDFGWLQNSEELYFLSEEDGYSHLFLHSLESGKTARLTEGKYEVSNPQLPPDEKYFYFTANYEHPGIYETFRVARKGGKTEAVTTLGGRNRSRLSPDGESLLILHSTTTHPPEIYTQPARPGGEARRMTHTVSNAFLALPWVAPQIVEVPSTHQDRAVYSRLYPAQGERTVGPNGKHAAVLFVHGAGYLQNSHHGWSGYFREFMFHTWLSQNGYTVLDMDYRASAGYGRDWRTAIYRQMGTPELEDLGDGVSWLVHDHQVDPSRVGVYGGSYGGFMTFMALFKEPDLFACGAALRPVTDWAHYNHGYTSAILNTPEIDPEAYERSSPIEFAEGLKNPLLICAGMQDDNVFFQDTVRLVQRLIELEKEDWETAIYPVEAHGFRRPSSWLDEYRRIFKLFETHLQP